MALENLQTRSIPSFCRFWVTDLWVVSPIAGRVIANHLGCVEWLSREPMRHEIQSRLSQQLEAEAFLYLWGVKSRVFLIDEPRSVAFTPH